ncbi:MAG: TDT family transporter [Caulobacteraceae bacterium]|nr:TDT family transporter [Caulobacter sp.]
MSDHAGLLALAAGARPLSNLSSPREVIRQFTPNWFTASMGTGILSVGLALVPAPFPALKAAGEALWILNIGLFTTFSALYLARWLMFPQEAARIFGHSVVSMFFGAIPMALATIINGTLIFGIARFGAGPAVAVAQALWWADAAMSLACGVAIPFMMFTRQRHEIEQMTAVWLLPVVAAEVAAASGGLLAPHLTSGAAYVVLLTSYALWAYSVPIALSMLVILVLRMALHKLPHSGMAASSWLALGPIGTGALGLLVLGADAPAIFAAQGLPALGPVAQGMGAVGGLLLWGYGVWWLLLGVLVTLRHLREGFPFNLGWWAYTFPIGVYSVATLRLAGVLHAPFFAWVGACLVAGLAVMWLVVGARTVAGAWSGKLFVAPCLATEAARERAR